MAATPSNALDALRARVMADDALQMELARLEEQGAFATAALAAAARGSLPLVADDLAAALRPDPLGLSRLGPAPAGTTAWPSRHWLPVGIAADAAGGLVVDWAHFAGTPLAEPFFAESARRAQARPFNRLFRLGTALDAFIDNRPAEAARPPDGFVFHMSRCGSTLVARMLAALPETIVVSEAPALDAVVRLAVGGALPGPRRAAALRAMVAALGRRSDGAAGRCVFKLDSWHAVALPLFREAFPGVPWLFLYRDPVEVLASQMHRRGPQTIAGMSPLSLDGVAPEAGEAEEDWCARVLARPCEAAIAELGGEGGGMALNYAALPDAVPSAVLGHFGMACDAAGRAAMAAAAGRDAKAPASVFAADWEVKRPAADAPIRAAAARHLAWPYRRLEALSARRAAAASARD
jgi:hypothetical protein